MEENVKPISDEQALTIMRIHYTAALEPCEHGDFCRNLLLSILDDLGYGKCVEYFRTTDFGD